MYLEPIRKQRAPGDDPSTGMRLGLLAVVVIILFSVLGFRLWFLQILSGDRYLEMADDNRLRTVKLVAPRGVIYDRNGNVLVSNRAGLSVGVLPMDLRSEDEVLPRLAELLGLSEEEVRAKVEKGRKDPYITTIIKEDVPESPVVDYLLEHRLEFPGVRVDKSYVREYPFKARATHLLGYVGEISADDLLKERFRTLRAGDRIGKDGVEAVYDSFLRGVDGERVVEVDAAGRPKKELEVKEPLPGKNLVLTLDSAIQEAAERAIVKGIERAREDGFVDAAAGAVVALDPKNGEVLAMTSYPDYDPSLWVGGMKQKDWEALNAKEAHNPVFDRATQGRYPLASTFKPFVAIAALKNDIISWDTSFSDPGYFKIGQQRWNCWAKDGHGEVNLVEALMMSCDTYFYNLGQKFYYQPASVLQDGVRQFGFGRTSGIDLLGEYPGQVPDKDWKKKKYRRKSKEEQAWKPGDDVNLSIGQGDLLATPLQLAVAFSAIANGHVDQGSGQMVLDVMVPRLALQITDAANNAEKQFETERRSQISVNAEDLQAVRKGLRYVTSEREGTAHGAFKGFPIPVVGKTGTAEKKPEDDYAWFMAYAPADDPQILVVALVEQGGHGSSVAAPVVRQVLEAFFAVEPSEPSEVTVTE